MRRNVTVSVIIPTYNRAHLVDRAMRSVLTQTYQNWELIVVDDGSTDDTQEVVQSYSDTRIHYLYHEVNRGGAVTRNTGIRAAQGEYIAFLDSDDEWLPEKLEKQLKVFGNANGKVGAVYAGIIFIDQRTGKRRIKRPGKRGMIYQDVLVYNPVGTASGVVVRRKCFDEVGVFDEGLASCQDWEMWIRLAKRYEFEYVSEPLVNYFEHDFSISTNHQAVISGHKALWNKYGIEKTGRGLKSFHYFRLGNRLCYCGETSIGRQYLFKAILVAPWNPKYIIGFTVSVLGKKPYHSIVFAIHEISHRVREALHDFREKLSNLRYGSGIKQL